MAEQFLGKRSGAAAEHGKPPGGKLERQVKMLVHGIDAEPEYGHLQKRGIRKTDSCSAKEHTDAEFDLVGTANHTIAFGYGMHEMTVCGTGPFGNDHRVGLQPTQTDQQIFSRNASRDIDRVNGNAAGFALIDRTCHPASLSWSRCASPLGKPVMQCAALQTQNASVAGKEV